MLDGSSQGIIAEQIHQLQHDIAAQGGQRIGKQAPNLTLQDQITVKAQQVIQQVVAGEHGKQIHHCGAGAQVQHQVWDALIPVLEAETVEFFA